MFVKREKVSDHQENGDRRQEEGNDVIYGGQRQMLFVKMIIPVIIDNMGPATESGYIDNPPTPPPWKIRTRHLPAHSQGHDEHTRRLAIIQESWAGLQKGIDPVVGSSIWFFVEDSRDLKIITPRMLLCVRVSVRSRVREGPTSSNGTCARSPTPCSLFGIHERMPELEGPPLAPHSLHR